MPKKGQKVKQTVKATSASAGLAEKVVEAEKEAEEIKAHLKTATAMLKDKDRKKDNLFIGEVFYRAQKVKGLVFGDTGLKGYCEKHKVNRDEVNYCVRLYKQSNGIKSAKTTPAYNPISRLDAVWSNEKTTPSDRRKWIAKHQDEIENILGKLSK